MTREEAIEHLRNLSQSNFYPRTIMALDMAIEALHKTKWIPCSERLPKENGEYIVSLEDSVYPWASFFNGKWFMLSFGVISREFGEYEVIAWMVMPEPYKAESEDKE